MGGVVGFGLCRIEVVCELVVFMMRIMGMG